MRLYVVLVVLFMSLNNTNLYGQDNELACMWAIFEDNLEDNNLLKVVYVGLEIIHGDHVPNGCEKQDSEISVPEGVYFGSPEMKVLARKYLHSKDLWMYDFVEICHSESL